MRPISGLVALEKECAIRRRDLVTGLANERDARVGQPASLLLDFLALVVVERREVVGEIAVAAVAPVELHSVAHEHARGSAFARLLCVDEQHVERRVAVAQLAERALEQRTARRRVVGEHACARHRRERHGGDELRVITPSVAAVRIRPTPVEYVFAIAVRLDIQRQCADQRRAVPRGEEARLPAGFARRATRVVQRGEVFGINEVGAEILPMRGGRTENVES